MAAAGYVRRYFFIRASWAVGGARPLGPGNRETQEPMFYGAIEQRDVRGCQRLGRGCRDASIRKCRVRVRNVYLYSSSIARNARLGAGSFKVRAGMTGNQ